MLRCQPKGRPARCFAVSESAWARTESLLPPAREEGQQLCPQGRSQVKLLLPSHVRISPVATCLSLSPYSMGQPGNHFCGVALPQPPTQPGNITVRWLLPQRPAWVLMLLPLPIIGSSCRVAAQLICLQLLLCAAASLQRRDKGGWFHALGSGTPAQPRELHPGSPWAGWDAGREGSRAGWPSWHQQHWVGASGADVCGPPCCPAQPPHLSWGGWLAPSEMGPEEGLCRRARPDLWGGLVLDTDIACDLRESLKD